MASKEPIESIEWELNYDKVFANDTHKRVSFRFYSLIYALEKWSVFGNAALDWYLIVSVSVASIRISNWKLKRKIVVNQLRRSPKWNRIQNQSACVCVQMKKVPMERETVWIWLNVFCNALQIMNKRISIKMANEWKAGLESEKRSKSKANSLKFHQIILRRFLAFQRVPSTSTDAMCARSYDFVIVWHSIKEPRRNWADINLPCCCFFSSDIFSLSLVFSTVFIYSYTNYMFGTIRMPFKYVHLNEGTKRMNRREKKITWTVYIHKRKITHAESVFQTQTLQSKRSRLQCNSKPLLYDFGVSDGLLCSKTIFVCSTFSHSLAVSLTQKYPCEWNRAT